MPTKKTFEVDEPIVTVLPTPKLQPREHRRKYWACDGTLRKPPFWRRLWNKAPKESEVWSLAFYDQESAEIHAARDHGDYPWVCCLVI